MEATKKDRKQYYQDLRLRWARAKEMSATDDGAKAIYEEAKRTTGKELSYTAFYFTLQDMEAQGLEGLPYIDCKTYKGWKESGYIVKKGEKSVIDGITWLEVKNKDDEEEGAVYPKLYRLFHKSQVQPL